ncbi:serine O-acetyltransferase [Hyunsoonleella jejuensis]|uniref:Serine O-acetyltransferase n=1 Tax=Hyunsoonleella jejuensis TaxID=419940 RepID=A0A1H9AZ62_9FLAO|nr:serine acetyltransferase [Hyunsoonleella jejuensis]SEP81899.1 serine O-acetyltransferase [Hyunsoonleella jejuensis]
MINAYYFYRFSHILYNWKVPILPSLIKLICFLIYNSSIPFQCKLGKGTRFGYGAIGVVIHKRVVVGANTVIGTNVTIGGKSGHYDVPIIGENVFIATGAKILGPIVIGNNVTIGANAVVVKNVPDNVVVAGIPAKIIKYKEVPKEGENHA